jgi:Permeases
VIGFFAIVTLDYLRVRGAILIGIVGVTVLESFSSAAISSTASSPRRRRSRRRCSNSTFAARCRAAC